MWLITLTLLITFVLGDILMKLFSTIVYKTEFDYNFISLLESITFICVGTLLSHYVYIGLVYLGLVYLDLPDVLLM